MIRREEWIDERMMFVCVRGRQEEWMGMKRRIERDGWMDQGRDGGRGRYEMVGREERAFRSH